MAVAELDSSGTMLETAIKIISIENAKEKPQDAFVATYNANSSNMILNLKYTDDIEATNKVITIEKQSGGFLTANYILKIFNTSNNKTIEYKLMEMPKELYVKNDVIAINYGTDVEIISAQSGWLIKKYVSRKDIRNVLISSASVAIEYNDEIKLIKF